ncbi:MAG: hypothetical protein MI802_15970 [Desulfobacterales bacterium]|nr:hypothetical protein [Desulfobacterales bacterium]
MNVPLSDNPLSVEVQLAWEVMTCRGMRTAYDGPDHACQWFNRHYGPFPAFDRIKDYPAAPPGEDEQRTVEAACSGSRFQIPELMSGCRKAPVMTIGINPNLTAFWPGHDGATWAYPYFDDIGQYAEYFRHRSVCQERFPLEFIHSHLKDGSKITAVSSGNLKRATRSKRDEQVTIELDYDDGPAQTLNLDRAYEVFMDRGTRFANGDVIAGIPDLPVGETTPLIQEEIGYYTRFRKILKRFKDLSGEPLAAAELKLGEDVCQADMVGCASPGWGSWFSDTAREGITEECVRKRGWLAQQLLQTRPAVVVFAGLSAYGMFYRRFKMDITPSLPPEGDTFEILKACSEGNFRLKASTPGGDVDARILISPHFSYGDNFDPQCRFDRDQWKTFTQEFPKQADLLTPVTTQNWNKSRTLVFIEREGAPGRDQLGEAAWDALTARRYDAVDLLGKGLHSEYTAGRLAFDPEHGGLARAAGPCEFCSNALFRIHGGCRYTPDRPAPSPDTLRTAARTLIKNHTP